MTTIRDQTLLFNCWSDELVGIVACPKKMAIRTGVLLVVGGPQYRVGSHRQFVLLSRELARQGISCMRFDYRGMGDSGGEQRNFECVDDDIRAAIDAYYRVVPELSGVMLWGLCDGATAAAFYAANDSRVSGLMLLNPWVKTEAGEAKAYLKHYYLKRLCSVVFWKKLISGGVELGGSIRDLGRKLGRAGTHQSSAGSAATLPEQMFSSLKAAALPVKVLLSGRDYVAREFAEVASQPKWQELLPARLVERHPEADHTFSTADARAAVAANTAAWVKEIDRGSSI